jgi:spore maturation protein SpmA
MRTPIVDHIPAAAVLRWQSATTVEIMTRAGTAFLTAALAEIVATVKVTLRTAVLPVSATLIVIATLLSALASAVTAIVMASFAAVTLSQRRMAQYQRGAQRHNFD